MLCLALAHQDILQLAILVDNVFNHHDSILYDVVSNVELWGFVTTVSRASGLHQGVPPVGGVTSRSQRGRNQEKFLAE